MTWETGGQCRPVFKGKCSVAFQLFCRARVSCSRGGSAFVLFSPLAFSFFILPLSIFLLKYGYKDQSDMLVFKQGDIGIVMSGEFVL